tara:strand:+ start:65 stop:622 length:558 start_codon:yes stop_codon:yes gene_type:complete
MGNRRLSRKRLYQVEKAGQSIDLESGLGIKDAVVSASQHRQGQELITEIAIDLGTSKAAIIGGNTDTNAIGASGKEAHITRLTTAKFGIITEVRAVVVEQASGDVNNLDLETKSSSTVNTGDAPGTPLIADLTVVGTDTSVGKDDNSLADEFLFVCSGVGSGSGAAMTGGKLLIYIHGFEAPADL